MSLADRASGRIRIPAMHLRRMCVWLKREASHTCSWECREPRRKLDSWSLSQGKKMSEPIPGNPGRDLRHALDGALLSWYVGQLIEGGCRIGVQRPLAAPGGSCSSCLRPAASHYWLRQRLAHSGGPPARIFPFQQHRRIMCEGSGVGERRCGGWRPWLLVLRLGTVRTLPPRIRAWPSTLQLSA